MLAVVPLSDWSWDFRIENSGIPIAKFQMDLWREAADLWIHGEQYRACRQSLFSGSFHLEKDGSVLALANKPSMFSRSLEVKVDGRSLKLVAQDSVSRSFKFVWSTTLYEDGESLGTVFAGSRYNRHFTADLPDSLDDAARTFLIWLVVVMRRRCK